MVTLIREQQLPISLDDAWDFFSKPVNLSKITPKEMNFIIKTPNLTDAYAGQIIEYTVSPLFSIPLTWVTEISQVENKKYFVDTQLQGPYKVWHHEHFFTENDQGVLMKDILNYQLPYGFFGKWMGKLFISKKVEDIFTYRRKAIEEFFQLPR
ncbi:SRPBCC family protein [Apibacter raozihei]|uniref:SRPBCC family protein n=1 Tax=Apibacter raozihei TaxID=2500547 RepID=UPI000FE366C6|nr:SRPBCC family protein [Apibacter raozihei]